MNPVLPNLHVGCGTTAGALTVFPIWIEAPSVARLDWNPTALAVDEREGHPVVEELVVRNRSPHPAVVLEGDLLEGGWQNRMAAESRIVAAGEAAVLPVRCVEQGRWHGATGGGHEASGRRSSYVVRYGSHDTAADRPDQAKVWRRIQRFEEHFGRTQSASLTDHLRASPVPRMHRLQGQRGVVVGIGGRVLAAELFGSRTGLIRRWDGIVAAAWLDARLAPAVPTRAEAAREFVRRLGAVSLEDRGDAGRARHVASKSRDLAARGIAAPLRPSRVVPLVHAGRPVPAKLIHLTAFDPAHPALELA